MALKDPINRAEYNKRYQAEHRKEANEASKRSYQRHKEKKLVYSRAYQKLNRARYRELHRIKNTGWTAEMVKEAWARQEGRCAICKCNLIDGGSQKNSLAVDHDHISKKPRELLCKRCNIAVGYMEKGDILDGVVSYIQRWRVA